MDIDTLSRELHVVNAERHALRLRVNELERAVLDLSTTGALRLLGRCVQLRLLDLSGRVRGRILGEPSCR